MCIEKNWQIGEQNPVSKKSPKTTSINETEEIKY
jgi:hypothetical protein